MSQLPALMRAFALMLLQLSDLDAATLAALQNVTGRVLLHYPRLVWLCVCVFVRKA